MQGRAGLPGRGAISASARVCGAALALALAVAAGPAAATQEYVLPTLFDVAGVRSDDVLNIRERPSASSPVIGRIPHDAQRIEVVAHSPDGRWGRVNTRERSGWVSMRYLNYRTDVWESGSLPPTLSCTGTEPFWGFTPGPSGAVLSTPDGETRYPSVQVMDTGWFRSPKRAVVASGDRGTLTAVMSPAQCSDGMSDRAYGLEATVILHGPRAQMYSGCCLIAPPLE